MKRLLALTVTLILVLSGCRAPFSLPQAKEPRGLAIASVLGAGIEESGMLRVMAATQTRGEKGLRLYESQGPAIAAALLSSRDQGTETVSYAHVEHIVIEEGFAERALSELLSFCFQNGEQSVESNLWLLRDGKLDQLFTKESDPAGRLSTLRSSGKAGTSLPPRSLRALAVDWADGEAFLIPALRIVDGELLFDSFALMKNEKLLGYIEGEAAIGCVLLAGDPFHWSETLYLEDGNRITVQLYSKGSSVTPRWDDKTLRGLQIACSAQGSVSEGWAQDQWSLLSSELESRVRNKLDVALKTLQKEDADAVSLCRQAGLREVWCWDRLQEQWDGRFAQLPYEIEVKLRLGEGL